MRDGLPQLPPDRVALHDQLRAAADGELDTVLVWARGVLDEFGPVFGAARIAQRVETLAAPAQQGLLTVALIRLVNHPLRRN